MPDHDSYDKVSGQLRLEFIEDFQDRLLRMEAFLQHAQDGTMDNEEALQGFRRELHNIKGTAGAFGFPGVSMISHRFEECLLHLPSVMFGTSRIVLLYLAELKEISDAEEDIDEVRCRELLRSLPLIGKFPEADGANEKRVDTQVLEVLVVAGSGTIRHMVRKELLDFGFHVTTVPDGIVALSMIVRGQPDVVVVSGTVESMPGFDLIRALVSMKSTHNTRVAALTSFGPDHPDVLMLPEGIPIIQLEKNMKDQISKALSALEYRFL